MSVMRLLSILFLFVYCFSTFSTSAQLKPKIGLVLSGGGAKGAAHIGVLKVIEQYNIPIDYVVGTSIGAYVGGLYALGYSANDIEKIMLNLPWDDSFSDFIPRQLLSFKNKELRDQYNISLRLGFSNGEFKSPSGFLLGQSAGNLMKLSTDVVPQFDSFDNLAIPYRAVASDLATAKVFVINKGSITKAMRASAAVPGVVEPVEIDGRLLVDGGIANNMPIDVVKAMGANVVIAVDIGSPLLSKKNINNTLDVFDQLSNILTNNTTQAQKNYLSTNDILIRPDIDDLSTTDFSIMPQALELGKQAALLVAQELKQLSVNKKQYIHYQQEKKKKRSVWFNAFVQPIIAIDYQNNSKVSTAVIKEKLALKIGDIVTKEQLQEAIARVYAINQFEHVDAEFIDYPQGRKLIVSTQAKSWGPNYLNFGFSLESDFSSRSIVDVDFAYIQNDVNQYGGLWINEAKLGWESILASELYQPLDENQYYFTRARIQLSQEKWEKMLDRPELVNKYIQTTVSIGYNYVNDGTIEFGFIAEKGDLAFKNDNGASLDYDSVGSYLSFDYDSLNSINFPNQGNKFSIDVLWRNDHYQAFESIEPNDSSIEIKLDWRGAFHFKHHIFIGIASFSTIDNDTDFSVHVTDLGGFLNLSGYQKDALIGSHKAFAALVYQYDLGHEFFGDASVPLYLGTSLEAGNVWALNDNVKIEDVIKSGSLYLGTDTSFGPAVFGIGFASGGKSSVFLSVGKSF